MTSKVATTDNSFGGRPRTAGEFGAQPGISGRQPRLAIVLRLVLEHLDSGSVVALTPAELRLAHRLEGALAAFDVSSRVWSEPLAGAGEAG
jgi:hypothetical protein